MAGDGVPPVPQAVEDIVDVVTAIPHDRISERREAQIVDVAVSVSADMDVSVKQIQELSPECTVMPLEHISERVVVVDVAGVSSSIAGRVSRSCLRAPQGSHRIPSLSELSLALSIFSLLVVLMKLWTGSYLMFAKDGTQQCARHVRSLRFNQELINAVLPERHVEPRQSNRQRPARCRGEGGKGRGGERSSAHPNPLTPPSTPPGSSFKCPPTTCSTTAWI